MISPAKWIPIAIGVLMAALAVISALYQIFHVTYETQSNTADIAALRTEFATVRENNAAIKALQRDLNEIETQFCAADDLRNLMHAQDQRNYAIVYEKVFGQPYQIGNAFYPQVCRRPSMAR